MKRVLIALTLGSLLTLSGASVAAGRIISLGQLDAELYPDMGSTRTVVDAGSRLSARLRAIDAVLYPDSFGAERMQLPDVGCDVAADQCFGMAV